MTIREAKRSIAAKLAPVVGDSEAAAMASAILEEVKGYTPVEMAVNADRELLYPTVNKLNRITDEIISGVPMQYALGTAWFHGRKFSVNPSVLIPRPETSELIDIITRDLCGRSDLRVLDIGTGSGCIAISLALDLPFSAVDAIDISPDALVTAHNNAIALNATVKFIVADALHLASSRVKDNTYDVIVSNPPYVLDSERAGMDPRVSDHEPSTALFVPDDNPLLFYDAIAAYATRALPEGGHLYFEINPLCADRIVTMLSTDFDAEALRDYKGNYRFVKAVRL